MRSPLRRLRDGEIWLVLNSPRLTDAQLALIVGTSASTIHNLRWRLSRRGWVCSVRYGHCPHCGRQAAFRGASPTHAYHTNCRPEAKRDVTRRREERLRPGDRQLARIARYRESLQQRTIQLAQNAGRRWTEDEEQIVLDLMDQPILETCQEVQRSFAAVSKRRSLLRRRQETMRDQAVMGDEHR